MIDLTYATTSQGFYPEIRNFYRSKPKDSAPTPVSSASPTTSHREKLDSPEILHHSCSNDAIAEPKVELGKMNVERNERGTPLKWSRFPQEGCKAPSNPSTCNLTRPPSKCDCPCSCCSRTACRADTPVCICGIPCTEPTGHPLICDACLCYVFPGNPKAFSTKHFCPRTESDAPQCPECKSILPKVPVQEKESKYLPVHFNVPKTQAPIFRKVTRTF